MERAGEPVGFTVVELLITLGILSLALLPMMEAFSRLWQARQVSTRVRTATMLGRDWITRVRAQNRYRRLHGGDPQKRGTFDGYPRYRWERSIRPINGSDPEHRALLIKLRVWFRSGPDGWRSLRCRRRRDCDRWDFVSVVTKRGLPD